MVSQLTVEWLDEPAQVLGQVELREAEKVATIERVEKEQRRFSTEEKLLIAGLLLNLLGIAWQVFQWRKEKSK